MGIIFTILAWELTFIFSLNHRETYDYQDMLMMTLSFLNLESTESNF